MGVTLTDSGPLSLPVVLFSSTRLSVRDLRPPLGVRANPGVKSEDEFEFDFGKDRVMLDTCTPVGHSQGGGGFGPTGQLKDYLPSGELPDRLILRAVSKKGAAP